MTSRTEKSSIFLDTPEVQEHGDFSGFIRAVAAEAITKARALHLARPLDTDEEKRHAIKRIIASILDRRLRRSFERDVQDTLARAIRTVRPGADGSHDSLCYLIGIVRPVAIDAAKQRFADNANICFKAVIQVLNDAPKHA